MQKAKSMLSWFAGLYAEILQRGGRGEMQLQAASGGAPEECLVILRGAP